MDDCVTLELYASEKGWLCSGCGLFSDCFGRPIFGNESYSFSANTSSWIENKPKYKFCPGCGKPVRGEAHE